MALAGAGRAEEVDDLVALDEVELGERQDPVPVERRLEGEVEAGQRLDGRELGHPERHLDAPVLAQGQFLGEQGIDHLERAGLATLELTHGLIKDLQRPRHLQADQGLGGCGREPRERSPRSRSRALSLAGQALADGLVEVEGAGGDDVTGADDQDRPIAAAIGECAASCDGPARSAAACGLRGPDGWRSGAVFEDLHLVGERVHLDDPLPGGIGNAVEIAADAHHAFMGDPPFQLEHRAEGRERQGAQVRLLLGEGLVDDALRGGVHPRIGDRIEPMPQLGVEIVEIAERAGEEEVLADIPERPLDLALGLGPVGAAGLRLEAVMPGEVDQRAVVDDAADVSRR